MSDMIPTPTERNPFITRLEPSLAGILGLSVEADASPAGPRLAPPLVWPECECPDDCRLDHEND